MIAMWCWWCELNLCCSPLTPFFPLFISVWCLFFFLFGFILQIFHRFAENPLTRARQPLFLSHMLFVAFGFWFKNVFVKEKLMVLNPPPKTYKNFAVKLLYFLVYLCIWFLHCLFQAPRNYHKKRVYVYERVFIATLCTHHTNMIYLYFEFGIFLGRQKLHEEWWLFCWVRSLYFSKTNDEGKKINK